MSAPLLSIDRWKRASFSGVKTVKLVLPDDVQTYTDPNAEAGIVVKPGKTIYHVELDPGTGGCREELRTGDHGDYHERRIGFDVRHLRQEVVEMRRRCMNQRVHVIFTDLNCKTFLYLNTRLRQGTADNPARGANGTRFEFRGAGVPPAPFVIGELLPGPAEGGDISISNPITRPADPLLDEGEGTIGGGVNDDLGGPGEPGDPDPGGGGTDPVDPSDVLFSQPSTGKLFRIIIDDHDGVETIEVPQ